MNRKIAFVPSNIRRGLKLAQIEIDAEKMDQADWNLLIELSVVLQRLRIPMRNSQLSYPLSEARNFPFLT